MLLFNNTMKCKLDTEKIENLVQLAIKEDIGTGDITTNSIIPDNLVVNGKFFAKEPGIVAGLPVVEHIFLRFEDKVCFKNEVKDGDHVSQGDLIARVEGDARIILSYERISLNFLQRLSGIATLTSMYAQKSKRYGIKIVDTRKTTAGWRYFEKYAVRIGGGENHRFGLYDQVMIKDNHLSVLSLSKSHDNIDDNCRGVNGENDLICRVVRSVRNQIPKNILIEIEVDKVENVIKTLESEADIIMFDNMDPGQISASLQIVKDWQLETKKKRPLIEVSGNVNLENIDSIMQHGIDRIAIGAITHSVKALDISLEIILKVAANCAFIKG